MMRLAEMFARQPLVLSFEVYPPKNDAGRVAMYETVTQLKRFRPAFFSCTYGAGGSTRAATLEICRNLVTSYDTPATAHLTCVGSSVDELRAILREARTAGVSNIMALRGDPPKGQTQFQPVAGGLRYAVELVALIRREFPEFGIGVAGYPETHQEALSPEADLDHLARKVDAGGEAVFCQLFYDNADYWRFRDRCQARGIRVPIVPGILPIVNYAQIQRITSLCKARIPAPLRSRLEAAQHDTEAQKQIGIDHATEQCADLIRGGAPGIHFYVLNLSDAATRVLDDLNELVQARQVAD